MAGTGAPDGWWMASDGRWYPPELHPSRPPPPPPAETAPAPAPPPPPPAQAAPFPGASAAPEPAPTAGAETIVIAAAPIVGPEEPLPAFRTTGGAQANVVAVRAAWPEPTAPSVPVPDHPGWRDSHRRSLRGVLVAAVVVLIAVGVVVGTIAIVKNNEVVKVPVGPGDAVVTWQSTLAQPAPGAPPPAQSFDGTVAGLPLAGTATQLPDGPGSPGASGAAGLVLIRFTGTLGGTPFTLDVTVDLAKGSTLSPNSSTPAFKVDGTLGSQPVTGTVGFAPGQTDTALFVGSVGNLRVSGTFRFPASGVGEKQAMATFTVTK